MNSQTIDSNTVALDNIRAKRPTARHSKTIILAFCLACLCFCSAQVFAGTVDSGYIEVGPYDIATFNLSGNGFTVSGEFDTSLQWQVQQPLGQYGGTLGVSGTAISGDFLGGSATIGTQYYPSVNWGSSLNGPPTSDFYVTGGPAIPVNGPGIYTTTFSMTGSLCGMVGGPPGPCDISLPDVSGSGTVTVDIGDHGGGFYYLEDATYNFGGSTPEPSSIMLFGSGILGLGGLLRKRFLG